ncbi:hypothetical protein Sjap_016423 [Stephania japonica]|uniref:DUF7950 domain-containing protein n=1 Tax=Stephania japonica TaxID=461633 RepID=A0AAP0NUZ1_9MAGN
MDGRGGCCIARTYAGGIYDASKIDRIMLRFRPIAPKPAAGGPASDEKTVSNNVGKTSRAKRRYVRDGSKKSCQSGRKRSKVCDQKRSNDCCVSFDGFDPGESEVKVVTLPLLPEKPVEKDTPTSRSPSADFGDLTVGSPWRMSSTHHDHRGVILCGPGERTVVIVVECVTDVCVGGGGGDEGERRLMSLERDTCPGFVSDGWDRVGWTNEAFREMVMMGEEGHDQVVWLVVKERLPVTCQSFTCRVRVQYTWRKERHSVMVPCDVWRINGGGLAWRLDVKAALSLGR